MKKTHLFILLQIVSISKIVSEILHFTHPTPLANGDNDPVNITILDGNPQNGRVLIRPASTVPVEANTKVEWVIDPNSNVESFRIQKKWWSSNIFRDNQQPPSNPTRRGAGTVGNFANKTYSYNILWRMKNDSSGKEYKFDPKLAINPRPFNLFHLLASFMVWIFSFFLLKTKKEKVGR